MQQQKHINILSLFDGISSGQLALQKAGIPVNQYFASEIDKHAIKVTQHNFPNTVQLGSVVDVKAENLPKIDLICAGSPCQGFSLAGKQLNFEDPRSKLFFEFVRLLKECAPKYFLLENVKMKKEYENVITEILGVEPIEINSALVSAQNRERLYWTNIPDVKQPEDKGVLLKNIVGQNYDESLILKGRGLNKVFKSRNRVSHISNKKCGCLLTKNKATDAVVFFDDVVYRYPSRSEGEALQTVPVGYTNPASYNQAMCALGNGWTVDVIVHILKNAEF